MYNIHLPGIFIFGVPVYVVCVFAGDFVFSEEPSTIEFKPAETSHGRYPRALTEYTCNIPKCR